MPQPIKVWLDTLLQAILTRLVTTGVFGQDNIFLALDPDASLKYPPTDQFAVIAPGRQRVDERIRVGAGRTVLVLEGDFTLTLFSRLAMDQTPRDGIWLTESTLGSLALLQNVTNNLEQFVPTDTSGNMLVPVPVELVEVESYERNQSGVGWGAIRSRWKMNWQADIATSIP